MSVKQAILDPLSSLPHAREVQDYLISMAAALTTKRKPPSDYIHDLRRKSGIFIDHSDIDKVIDMIRDIFQEKGYRTPWELENDLIKKAYPEIPDEAIEHADHYAASELAPDHLTGYLQKPRVPLIMGFAALFHEMTGQPVSAIDIDLSNVRGTNEHNAKVYAAAEGITIEQAMAEAMARTDQMAFIVAQSIRAILITHVPELKYHEPDFIRTGGDEMRIVIPGMDLEKAKSLLPLIHEKIEILAALMGAHDHVHGKHREILELRGFGGAASAFAIEAKGHADYTEKIRVADREISLKKMEIGSRRLNNPDFDRMKPAFSKDPELYIDADKAKTYSTDLWTKIAGLREALSEQVELPDTANIVTLEHIVDRVQPTHFLTVNQIQSAFYHQMKEDLRQSNLSLTPAQERALCVKAAKYSAMDHATGTLAETNFAAMAGAALKVNTDLNERAGTTYDALTMGISFHNLGGLNETLGHENANVVLHHMVHSILIPALKEQGIAEENMVLAHMGGGEFRMIIQPIIFDADGTFREIDPAQLQKIAERVEKETQTLSQKNIVEFFRNHGMTISDVPETFSAIKNPRAEYCPYENGLTATTTTSVYKPNPNLNAFIRHHGGPAVAEIGNTLNAAINRKRSAYLPAVVQAAKLEQAL